MRPDEWLIVKSTEHFLFLTGVYEEHKHITQVNQETNNKIDIFSAKQQVAERILKDMHKDMRIALCKLKHLVCQVCGHKCSLTTSFYVGHLLL